MDQKWGRITLAPNQCSCRWIGVGQWHGSTRTNKVQEAVKKARVERIERLRRYRLAQLNGQQMAELEGVSRARISQLLKVLDEQPQL